MPTYFPQEYFRLNPQPHHYSLSYNVGMLQLSTALLNQPVMSIRTVGEIARTESAFINPNNLKIEGFYCIDQFSKQRLVLLTQDIRDQTKQGLIVDDHEVLTEPGELVRLQSVLELKFELLGKPV